MRHIGNVTEFKGSDELGVWYIDNVNWCTVLLLGYQMEEQTGMLG